MNELKLHFYSKGWPPPPPAWETCPRIHYSIIISIQAKLPTPPPHPPVCVLIFVLARDKEGRTDEGGGGGEAKQWHCHNYGRIHQ